MLHKRWFRPNVGLLKCYNFTRSNTYITKISYQNLEIKHGQLSNGTGTTACISDSSLYLEMLLKDLCQTFMEPRTLFASVLMHFFTFPWILQIEKRTSLTLFAISAILFHQIYLYRMFQSQLFLSFLIDLTWRKQCGFRSTSIYPSSPCHCYTYVKKSIIGKARPKHYEMIVWSVERWKSFLLALL